MSSNAKQQFQPRAATGTGTAPTSIVYSPETIRRGESAFANPSTNLLAMEGVTKQKALEEFKKAKANLESFKEKHKAFATENLAGPGFDAQCKDYMSRLVMMEEKTGRAAEGAMITLEPGQKKTLTDAYKEIIGVLVHAEAKKGDALAAAGRK